MKKLIFILLLLQISFFLIAQNKSAANKELNKTRYNLLIGVGFYAAGTFCTYNAYEAHQKYKFNYTRGYGVDIDDYFRTFKNQIIFSVVFTGTGLVLQSCALYHFAKYRELTENKVRLSITPSGVGIGLRIR